MTETKVGELLFEPVETEWKCITFSGFHTGMRVCKWLNEQAKQHKIDRVIVTPFRDEIFVLIEIWKFE